MTRKPLTTDQKAEEARKQRERRAARKQDRPAEIEAEVSAAEKFITDAIIGKPGTADPNQMERQAAIRKAEERAVPAPAVTPAKDGRISYANLEEALADWDRVLNPVTLTTVTNVLSAVTAAVGPVSAVYSPASHGYIAVKVGEERKVAFYLSPGKLEVGAWVFERGVELDGFKAGARAYWERPVQTSRKEVATVS